MKNTDRLSLKRLAYGGVMALVFFIGTLVLGIINSVLIDKLLCIFAINICFFSLWLIAITRKRLLGQLPEFNYISYGKITLVIILDWIIVILSSAFAPDFFAPVMVVTLLSNAVFDDGLNSALGIYFVAMLSICGDFGVYMVLCYMLLISFGTLIASFIRSKDALEKLYSTIIVFAVNTLVSVVFYYFNYVEISFATVVYGLVDGLLVCMVSATIVPLFNSVVERAQVEGYDEFLNPDYGLRQDIRKFSFIEYQHAERVSRLSRICAGEIHANEDLAACAGFYYRLGKMEGEPMIDNALRVANDHCFPEDVIQILSEYGGIISLPSSKESAIVHMVDSVVTKVELFDADSMSSTWNQNMVIYQTINELSQKGYYDNSGLTMNQFLIIRERLAKEDILK